ncbi:uncharacterized protein LOC125470355 [Pyrus x bretschneideri]|uniref:uncharacterized protein LOC125470355 n=1 Tax=Pyrus x bretschneideri TaxID=225117 RepID=UPI002030CBE2|nr:uncharacterized protein LOC125470355 [Pyrus x bretschneideri]
MVIWMIWKNRNDGPWSGNRLLPQDLLITAESWLQEYHKWHKLGAKKSMKVQQKWRRPGVNWVKCNFDGVWIQQGSRGGFGAVQRDHMGEFVAAATGPLGWTCPSFHAKLCAAQQALLLAQAYCPAGKRISFKGDSSL